ncbi:putative oxidoreductase SERP2049 [Mytilus galloprovincialis]|uniref:putative oxidoreductase SERP2049 n=1 Tax=Mytilus galloprovincialis TaxID=29158 RepID=UPI003F7CA7B3
MIMKYSGRVAFIAGGTGIVGSGCARSLLKEGAKVAVSSRSQQRLDDLKKSFSADLQKNLILIAEDIGTEAGAKKILKILQEQHGGVHHVLSAFGKWWEEGPLTEQSVEEFDNQMNIRAKSHFICCKTFLPVLAKEKDTTYTFVNGLSCEGVFSPNISLLAIGACALMGISNSAQAQYKDSNVAVNELRIAIFIKPKLDKDLTKEDRITVVNGMKIDTVGNDVIGDFFADFTRVGKRGLIRVTSVKDMETYRKDFHK